MFNNGYEEQWTKLAFVLKKGLEARSRFRIVEETALSKAQNVEFPVAGGPQKRRGHTGQDVTRLVNGEATAALNVETLSFEPFQPKVLPTNWLPGYGQVSNSVALAGTYERGGPSEYSSPCATARLGLGLVEVPATGLPAVWTGSEFVHGTGSSWDPSDTTYLPVAKSQFIAGDAHPNSQALRHTSGAVLTVTTGVRKNVAPNHSALVPLDVTLTSPEGVKLKHTDFETNGEFRVVVLPTAFVLVYSVSLSLYSLRIKFARISLSGTVAVSDGPLTSMQRLDACEVEGVYDIGLAYWTGTPSNTNSVTVGGQSLEVSGWKDNGTTIVSAHLSLGYATSAVPAAVERGQAVAITHNHLFGLGVGYCYNGFLNNSGTAATTDRTMVGFVRVADTFDNTADWGLHPGRYVVNTNALDTTRANDVTVFEVVEPLFPFNGNPTLPGGGAYADALQTAGWQCLDYGSSANPVPHGYAANYSKIAVAFRKLPEVNSGEYIADVCASTIAGQGRASEFGGADSGFVLTPVASTVLTTFDFDAPTYTGDTNYLLGYEVAANAINPGMAGVFTLAHYGLYGGPYVSWSGSQFGGLSMAPTLVMVDRQLRPIAKLADNVYWGGFTRQFYSQGLASLATCRISVLGDVIVSGVRETASPRPHRGELHLTDLDFVHPLRTAAIGNAVIVAGAAPRIYDGDVFGEYGFVTPPSAQPVIGWTSSGLTGVASLRAFMRMTTHTGEEFRSASLPFAFDVAKVVTDVVVTLPTTAWTTCELVIGCTKPNQPVYYECGRTKIDAHTSMSYDNLRSANQLIMGLELNNVLNGSGDYPQLPESSPGYLQPNSPPACEMVRAGQDRLWFAGGEVQPGSVTATNLYQPGFLPGWNDFHTQTVDRVAEPITDMAFLQDSAYLFKKRGVFLISSEGPDDYGQNGQWQQPRKIAQDGSPFYGTVQLTEQGIVFLGASGVKLITYGGGIQPMGSADRAFYRTGQIGKLLTPISATVYYPEKDQIRWYKQAEDAEGSAVIVESREGRYSTWTGVACTGAGYFANQRAVYVLKSNGRLWKEDADSGEIYVDDGTNYTMLIRTAWISPAGLGGFGRVRRVGWWGEWLGDHQVRMRVYINEKTEHEQEYTLDWTAQTTELSSVTRWGDSFWGSGPWGGTEGNRLWRWTRRMDRQKCSTIMFELSDLGAATASFAPVSFALEVGILPNLDRVRVTDATGGAGGV